MGNKKEKFSLKDELFNERKVKYLASLFVDAEKKFDDKIFCKEVLEKFPEWELKERIFHIRKVLKKHLDEITGGDYKKNIKIIIKALPSELDNTKTDNDFGDFILAPLGNFVATYGCEKRYLKTSFNALEEITKRFSVEFDIRKFINMFPEETLSFLEKMSKSNNYHQRRLSSEGLRPKLPWAENINIGHKKGAMLLDKLYSDNTRYVTRSVANHLNDIAKFDPDFVITKLKKWKKEEKQNIKEMDFITSHALRTLVKQGSADALKLLGFVAPSVTIKDFILQTKVVHIGENLEFSFNIVAKKEQKLLIDYSIFFQTKTGKINAKVFKLKQCSVKKNQILPVTKKHPLKIMTTKKLYPGEHVVEIQINGKRYESKKFILKT